MLAYNRTSLDNYDIIEEAGEALDKRLITKDEFDAIGAAHPVTLYSPNIFIRIGLFFATVVIVFMSFGLVMLFFGGIGDFEAGMRAVTVFFGLLVYAALEFLIRDKRHYRSGVDDALLWMSVAFIVGAVMVFSEMTELTTCIIIFILSMFATLRFANSVMSAVAFISFILIFFYAVSPLGTVAKIILPFLTMIVSAGIYWFAHCQRGSEKLRHYRFCLLMIEFLGLIVTYGAVNFYMVRELSITMFNLPATASISGSWLFWIFTFVIPVIYIWRGVVTKDALILRTGMLLSVLAVLTYRNYYFLAPAEQVMTIAGILMIAVAYFTIRFLRTPKNGVTDKLQGVSEMDHLNTEGLVVAETFPVKVPVDQGFKFGGGTTGGGGASGTF